VLFRSSSWSLGSRVAPHRSQFDRMDCLGAGVRARAAAAWEFASTVLGLDLNMPIGHAANGFPGLPVPRLDLNVPIGHAGKGFLDLPFIRSGQVRVELARLHEGIPSLFQLCGMPIKCGGGLVRPLTVATLIQIPGIPPIKGEMRTDGTVRGRPAIGQHTQFGHQCSRSARKYGHRLGCDDVERHQSRCTTQGGEVRCDDPQ
jgi:hypothetical protein